MSKSSTKNNYTQGEIEILKKHYKHELSVAIEKVKEIRLAIKKLNDLGKNVKEESVLNIRKIHSSRDQNNRKTSIRKKSVSIGWTNLIMETLQSKKTLLPSKAFLEIVVKKYKVSEDDKKKARSNITGCLSDLTKKYKRLVRYGEYGDKKGLYGLAEWFDSKGKPYQLYRQKFIMK